MVLLKVELGGLGGGDVGRAKGTLSGRLPRIDPNCGMAGRPATPRIRIDSDRSTMAFSFPGPVVLSAVSSSTANCTSLFTLGSRGKVELMPTLLGDDGGGGAGAGRMAVALEGNSMTFCGMGCDISN